MNMTKFWGITLVSTLLLAYGFALTDRPAAPAAKAEKKAEAPNRSVKESADGKVHLFAGDAGLGGSNTDKALSTAKIIGGSLTDKVLAWGKDLFGSNEAVPAKAPVVIGTPGDGAKIVTAPSAPAAPVPAAPAAEPAPAPAPAPAANRVFDQIDAKKPAPKIVAAPKQPAQPAHQETADSNKSEFWDKVNSDLDKQLNRK